jgi:hypothetical protein
MQEIIEAEMLSTPDWLYAPRIKKRPPEAASSLIKHVA